MVMPCKREMFLNPNFCFLSTLEARHFGIGASAYSRFGRLRGSAESGFSIYLILAHAFGSNPAQGLGIVGSLPDTKSKSHQTRAPLPDDTKSRFAWCLKLAKHRITEMKEISDPKRMPYF